MHRLASSSIWKIRQQPNARSTLMACSERVISPAWLAATSSMKRGLATPCVSVASWSGPRRSRLSFRRYLAWTVYGLWRLHEGWAAREPDVLYTSGGGWRWGEAEWMGV